MESVWTQPATSSVFSNVDRLYLEHRHSFEQRKAQVALRHHRRLVRKRGLFQKRLNQALSPQLQAELNIRVTLDTRYLSVPGFIGTFNYAGLRWVLGYRRSLTGGRWFFRALRTTKLYCCSAKTLEAQLCYALGQHRHVQGVALSPQDPPDVLPLTVASL